MSDYSTALRTNSFIKLFYTTKSDLFHKQIVLSGAFVQFQLEHRDVRDDAVHKKIPTKSTQAGASCVHSVKGCTPDSGELGSVLMPVDKTEKNFQHQQSNLRVFC